MASKLWEVKDLGGLVLDRPGTKLARGEFTFGTDVQLKDGVLAKAQGYSSTAAFDHAPLHPVIHMSFIPKVNAVTGAEENEYVYVCEDGTDYWIALIDDATDKADGQMTLGASGAITSITETAGTATVTRTAHGFSNDDVVEISGAVPAGYNGTWTISGVTANTFNYTVGQTLADASTPGNVQLQSPNILQDIDEQCTTCLIGKYGVVNVNRTLSSGRGGIPYVVPGNGDALTNYGWVGTRGARAFRSWDNRLWALFEHHTSPSNASYPYRVRWSSVSVDGAVPTSWDDADVTTGAGYIDLASKGGAVIDALELGDRFIVYREGATHEFRYVGGAALYGQDVLFDRLGILARNCMVEHRGIHYVFGNTDLWAHDGHRAWSLANSRLREFIFNDADTKVDETYYKRSFVFLDATREEVWFCYVLASGGTTCQIAWVYNINEDQWGRRSLPGILSMAQGFPAFGQYAGANAVRKNAIIWGDYSTTEFHLVNSGNTADGTNITAAFERDELVLDNVHVTKHIKALILDVEAADGVALTVSLYKRDQWGGTEVLGQQVTYTHGTNRRVTLDVKGKIFRLRVASTADVAWKISGYSFEYDLAGTGD